jgi:hypothetical protein
LANPQASSLIFNRSNSTVPLELSVWRIDGNDGPKPVTFQALDLESRLQDILAEDITIADPNLMVIGQEVRAHADNRVDILAIGRDGRLVVLELKRDKTPRDIVAQALDYGHWVRDLGNDEIARIFANYMNRHHPDRSDVSLDQAFCERFGATEMPDELNEEHELVIVASSLDPSTERIVNYLSEEYGVSINAVFFRVFKDGDREYLTRAWLREPGSSDGTTEPGDDGGGGRRSRGEWNGEYYVSFGHDPGGRRDWDDAREFGFISAGAGTFYTRTLSVLGEGCRVWVNVPSTGYVGVGRVTGPPVRADQFMVDDGNGGERPITEVTERAPKIAVGIDDERAERLVPVRWIKTMPLNQAIKEKGLFGNQNTVARPRTPKWDHTIDRLKKQFGVND